MPDITHKITIDTAAASVYTALSTVTGLSHWWTRTTAGESALGQRLEFSFGQHLCAMQVEELSPSKRVAWRCKDEGTDWAETALTFDLTEEAGRTTLLFGHRQWRESNAFMAHCSMKWATFLLSLRDYVERGEGKPFPNDVQIS